MAFALCAARASDAAWSVRRSHRAGRCGSRRQISIFFQSRETHTSPIHNRIIGHHGRARQADRLITIRLRMLIFRELDERDITTPAAIGEALGMPAAEATSLLTRHQWREGDVALLQAAAARLGGQGPAAPVGLGGA